MKILVAEDDVTGRLLVERILAKAGYSVTTAPDGKEALKQLQATRFDALVTDWMMPNLDGIALIRQAREEFDEMPVVVMMTSLSSQDAKAHALDSGADEFVAKPIEAADLCGRLAAALDRAHHSAAPPSAPRPVVPARPRNVSVPFPLVCVAASTGGQRPWSRPSRRFLAKDTWLPTWSCNTDRPGCSRACA